MKFYLRIAVAIFCVALGLQYAKAQTKEDWQNMSKKTLSLLMDCAQKQMIHSIQSGANTEAFIVVVEKLCDQQLTLFIQSTFGSLKANGWPDEEAKKRTTKFVTDIFEKIADLYTTFQKNRENK